jgi:hypothetical protein
MFDCECNLLLGLLGPVEVAYACSQNCVSMHVSVTACTHAAGLSWTMAFAKQLCLSMFLSLWVCDVRSLHNSACMHLCWVCPPSELPVAAKCLFRCCMPRSATYLVLLDMLFCFQRLFMLWDYSACCHNPKMQMAQKACLEGGLAMMERAVQDLSARMDDIRAEVLRI